MKKIITACILIFAATLPSTAFEDNLPDYTYVVFTGKYSYSQTNAYNQMVTITINFVNRPLKVDLNKYTVAHAKEAFKYKTRSTPYLLIETEDRRSIDKTLRETHPELMKRGGHQKITINTSDFRKAKEGKLKYGR